LTFKENYATLANYLKPIFDSAPGVQPLSVGMFGGKMEMFRLPFFQMLFVMVIIQAQPGDLRNWPLIDEWAADLRTRLIQEAGE
jgi:menaquinone-dependent protoporphyrinogen IX oxidase